jgi:CRISPR-associated protein Cas2
MFVLIAYDVATADPKGQRRLRKVARACEDFGQRVQKSVFECRIGAADWAVFKDRLLKEINLAEDSLRFYHLDAGVRVEHHGSHVPTDLDGPLIV